MRHSCLVAFLSHFFSQGLQDMQYLIVSELVLVIQECLWTIIGLGKVESKKLLIGAQFFSPEKNPLDGFIFLH